MSDAAHATLRHIVDRALIALALVLAFFAFMHHVAPPPAPVHASVAVFSAKPIERDAQALVAADQARAALSATQKSYTNLLNSYESLIVGGLQPRYVPKLTVDAKLVAPEPLPTPTPGAFTKEQIDTLFSAAKAADVAAMNDPATHIKVDATLSQAEAPQARIGTLLGLKGSGLAYDVVRRGQFDFELGGIVHASHISPAFALEYAWPHTSLSPGIVCGYDRRLSCGVGVTVRIAH